MTTNQIRLKRFVPVILLALFMTTACARNSYLNVNYLLPAPSDELTGKSVFLEVKDHRSEMSIFSETVQTEFESFTGIFSLTVEDPSSGRTLLGAYDLHSMFKEAFHKRLDGMGITAVDSGDQGIPELSITLKHFLIDLKGRQWVADVNYEATLVMDNQVIARETVSGSAERLKLVGKKDAEKMVSSIFSELVNKLPIERLFEQAQL